MSSNANATGCGNAAVVALFGLIATAQAAGGVFSLVMATNAIFDKQNWVDALVFTGSAALFGSIGFGLIAALLVARPQLLFYEIKDRPTAEPWLERPDWASGRIFASGGASLFAFALAAITVWWNVASLPLLTVLPKFLQEVEGGWKWLVLLFPVAGVWLIAAFIYQFLRARKFGKPVFEMPSVPGSVGGQLAGVVRIPRRVDAPDGFRVRLLCVEWLHRGRDRSRVDHVIWQDEFLVKKLLVEGNATSVPVLFAVPFNMPETSRPETNREFQWRLEVRANLAGIDYGATFDVPVYKTAESREGFQLDQRLLADYAPAPTAELAFRDAGIVRESLPGGVRLTFRAARNWRSAIAISLLAVAFAGIAFLMLWFNQETREFFNLKDVWQDVANKFGVMRLGRALLQTLMAIGCGTIFVTITLVMFFAGLDLWLYRSVVEASPAGLSVRGGWLGLGRKRYFAADDIKRFKLEEYMRSSGGGLWNSVVLVPRRGRGKKRNLGKGIASKLAQEAVIDELNVALVRKPS